MRLGSEESLNARGDHLARLFMGAAKQVLGDLFTFSRWYLWVTERGAATPGPGACAPSHFKGLQHFQTATGHLPSPRSSPESALGCKDGRTPRLLPRGEVHRQKTSAQTPALGTLSAPGQ